MPGRHARKKLEIVWARHCECFELFPGGRSTTSTQFLEAVASEQLQALTRQRNLGRNGNKLFLEIEIWSNHMFARFAESPGWC